MWFSGVLNRENIHIIIQSQSLSILITLHRMLSTHFCLRFFFSFFSQRLTVIKRERDKFYYSICNCYCLYGTKAAYIPIHSRTLRRSCRLFGRRMLWWRHCRRRSPVARCTGIFSITSATRSRRRSRSRPVCNMYKYHSFTNQTFKWTDRSLAKVKPKTKENLIMWKIYIRVSNMNQYLKYQTKHW